MILDPNNLIHLTIAAATFGLVLSLWLAVVLLWSVKRSARHKTIRERLQSDQPEVTGETRSLRLWREGRESVIERPSMQRVSRAIRLQRMLHDAGVDVNVRSLIGGTMAMVVLMFGLSWAAIHSVLPAIGAVAITGIVAYILLQQRISRRASVFELQFVDALDIAARSLRVGHPLVGAFRFISEEIPPPVGRLFGEICETQELGFSIERAIREVAKQSNQPDVAIFGTCVAIQLRSGGNLADMMERLAFVIRDRMRLNRRIRVLTAQTQFSKRILAALPILLFFVLNLLNPEYMHPLYTTKVGKLMLLAAALSVAAGMWLMNKISVLTY
jgi:tight adherence protein B